MIRNVFLPEKIGDSFLFSTRIVGIDITRTHVIATVVVAYGSRITVEKIIEEKLESNTIEHQERIAKGIKNIMRTIPKYNALHSALNNSQVVFKELVLPFTSHEQISMAIEFEVDPLLPFSAQNAVIDFIITKTNKEEKSSHILVAAVQKHHLAAHLQLFEAAGYSPDIVTVDLFALYELYRRIPSYQKNTTHPIALIDIGSQSTGIGYIVNGSIAAVRSLPKGMASIAKTISKELDLEPGQAIGEIFRYGVQKEDDPRYTNAVAKATKEFWHDISFTLNSFMQQESVTEKPKTVLLGRATDIEGLPSFLQKHIDAECEAFNVTELWKNPNIINHVKHPLRASHVISLSIALPSQSVWPFNLRKKEFTPSEDKLLTQQIVAAAGLIILLFGMCISFIAVQVHELKKEATILEEETIIEIKERFPKISDDEDDLDEVIDAARKEVTQQERLLSAFLQSPSSSILNYLLELTKRIDKDALGLEVDEITITQDKIKFKAKVQDYEALRILEHNLSLSPIFKEIEPQETPEFTMEIPIVQRKSHGNR